MNQLQTVNERDVASSPATADMKLEVVVIPVSDVDRAKRFYGGLGWRLDADFVVGDEFHVVQFTPPGSPVFDPASAQGVTSGPMPGSSSISSNTLASSSCRTSRQRAPNSSIAVST